MRTRLGVVALVFALFGGLLAAPAHAGIIPQGGNGIAAVWANHYGAWRVHVPAETQLDVAVTGVTDGSIVGAGVAPVGAQGGCCGSSSSAPLGQLRVANRGVNENVDAQSGSGGWGLVGAGDYYVVVIVGGGTASVGAVTVQLTGDDIVFEGFTSGPSKQLTDADFARGSVYAPQPGDTIAGKVTHWSTKSLWGMFFSPNDSAVLSVTDPAGITHELLDSYSFANAPLGRYDLRLSETFSREWSTFALLADVTLP